MRIAYVFDQLITCGGVIVPFEHCKELIRRGYDAMIIANGRNEDLERSFQTVPVRSVAALSYFDDNDIIVAAWWPQCEMLEQFRGRKIQFVQGNDLMAYVGDDWKQKCLATRQKENWKLWAVSQYAGEWTNRDFTIIPNALSERFFTQTEIPKDIDILIEGNDEPNKNIPEAIDLAKRIGGKIAWLGRETRQVEGMETFTNPPQDQIPRIYQRAKVFIKLSQSEGFCLPILEAMVSKCLVITRNMGGNDWCKDGDNCLIERAETEAKEHLKSNKHSQIVENGWKTAQGFTWSNTGDRLIQAIS